MKNKERKYDFVMPEYMQDFTCLAGNCEDSCCAGWYIDVDEETYQKYLNCSHQELKKEFEENVHINNRDANSSYARIDNKLTRNHICPFLEESKLCKIQLNLGEDYLSNTCFQYPRNYNCIDNTIELSGCPSCPKVAKDLLSSRHKIKFIRQKEKTLMRDFVVHQINTKASQFQNTHFHYILDIREFSILILQDRRYKLWERVVFLGLVIRKLDVLVENKSIDNIPSTMNDYCNELSRGAWRDSLASIPSQQNIQVDLIIKLLEKRLDIGFSSHSEYVDYLLEIRRGLSINNESNMEEVVNRYSDAYTKIYIPCMNDCEHILENYLVNFVFSKIFPYGVPGNFFEHYVFLVIHYSLIKIHLVGVSSFRNELNSDLMINIIQKFTKNVIHSKAFVEETYRWLKENNYNTLGYMTILLRE